MTTVAPDPTKPKQPDKSLGQLFGDLSGEFSDLVSTQMELFKTEMQNQRQKAVQAASGYGAAVVCAYMALLLLSFAAAWGLSEVMPEGVAFLIVGVAYAVAAGVLYLTGRNRAREVNLVPEDTIQSVKEDVQWARQKLS
jgi:uncharacterized membrane protein YqjE